MNTYGGASMKEGNSVVARFALHSAFGREVGPAVRDLNPGRCPGLVYVAPSAL